MLLTVLVITESYLIISFIILMKKPSISTTVDQERTLPPTPCSKKSQRPWPSTISEDFFELYFYRNWLYRTIGITYILECACDPDEYNILFEKLNTKEISIVKCRNIPNSFKESYDQRKLLEQISKAVEFAKEIVQEHPENKYQVEEMLNFINDGAIIDFAITLLIRSIALFQIEELLNERPEQFLGNEMAVLSDFSVNPEFKVIQLLSKVFNYSIKISNKTFKELDKKVNRSNPTAQLQIEKIEHRVFFSISLNKQMVTKKVHNTPFQIPKLVQKQMKEAVQESKQESPVKYPETRGKQKQKEKEKEKEKTGDSVNVSKQQQQTDRVKICLSCGEQRKPDQKFCECKKRKVTATKAIL